VLTLYGNGLMMGKSSISEIPQDKDCMMSQASNNQVQPANPSVIAESRRTNKKMTLSAKKNLCESNTQNMSLSLMSEAESISKENSSSGFWNKQVSEMSKKLWLPIEIDCVDLGLNSLNGSSLNTMLNSWFSMTVKVPHNKNLSQTCYQSLQFSRVEFTDSENILKRSRKIRFYPTKQQKALLFKWFGVSRYSFNKTIEYLRQPNTKANWYGIKTEIIHNLPEWSKEVPYQIKSIAIKDACDAVKSAKLKFKQTGKVQKVKFRSRKNADFNLYIPKTALNEAGFYHTLTGVINLREPIGEVKYDCRVILENGRYFLIKPEDRAIKRPDNQRLPVVALDPGVRTFQTIYSENIVGKFGESDFSRIYRLCYILDNLYSKRKKEHSNRYNRKLKRIRWKIKDLISEIHHKLALFLVKTFDCVLIPSFETSDMVTKLHSKVARAMLGWSHYRFKQFLKYKAQEYSCEVVEINEAYTSKTCGKCGLIQNIGSKKVLKCSCGLKIDRDYNGARNIFLKNIHLASKDSSIPDVYSGMNLT
jgi:putative transposase